ncbi:MAG: acetyl-CoA carboxylase biotin carboxylase subunit [Bacteroidetes bacterium]|nr:acetyl-CoA carboxylase biotin carboxylase subunit [Bacteroidota bacterium]
MKQIQKILIANRGEIACRIIRTAKKMGIKTVAVYSEIDHDSLHVSQADEAFCIGHSELGETYLNINKIVETAQTAMADAIHPGYGFLAENPLFVQACHDAGIIFIGPDARAMKIMGNKIEARKFAKKISIPITEGVTGNAKELIASAPKIGFPVLLKAAAGGGGKGMRIVHETAELEEAIESTARQAKAYFGDETVYIEKYIEEPRHIEVQILGDEHGNMIHLFERECSIQRRYQKIIEESPSPTLSPEVRLRMGEAAVRIGKEAGYTSAGTIEFLVDKSLNFYFLEMNTRIQVEHPVTEMVTGIDIVEEQIVIASGQPMRIRQEDVQQKGHAIECRIYAEDPSNNFQPSPGKMSLYKEPGITGIRIDTGIVAGTEIKSSFDPMISKLVVWGEDREEASRIMVSALQDYIIHGIKTNISFLTSLLQSESFASNSISTRFCDEHLPGLISTMESEKGKFPLHVPVAGYLMTSLTNALSNPCEKPSVWNQIGYWRDLMKISVNADNIELSVRVSRSGTDTFRFEMMEEQYHCNIDSWENNRLACTINGHDFVVFVSEDKGNHAWVNAGGFLYSMQRADLLAETVLAASFDVSGQEGGHITSPMPGKVTRINVSPGEEVRKGKVLLVIEAMKMENMITAPVDGIVKKVNVKLNQMVETSTTLVDVEKSAIRHPPSDI